MILWIGVTEIVCDGKVHIVMVKVYIVLVKDLLEAAHPLGWVGARD